MARKQATFVDWKGLNEFGQPEGLNPVWGVVASGLSGSGTAYAVRVMTGMDKNSELIGMGVGVATGLALMISPKSRAAGFTGVVTALITNGLRYGEALMSKKQQIKDLTGATVTALEKAGTPLDASLAAAKQTAAAAGVAFDGFGIVTAQPRTALQGGGFGMVTAEPRTALQGAGLGALTAEPRTALQGMAGIGASMRPDVTIQGASAGLARSFGATIF